MIFVLSFQRQSVKNTALIIFELAYTEVQQIASKDNENLDQPRYSDHRFNLILRRTRLRIRPINADCMKKKNYLSVPIYFQSRWTKNSSFYQCSLKKTDDENSCITQGVLSRFTLKFSYSPFSEIYVAQ